MIDEISNYYFVIFGGFFSLVFVNLSYILGLIDLSYLFCFVLFAMTLILFVAIINEILEEFKK